MELNRILGVSEGLNSVETWYSQLHPQLDTRVFQKDLIVWKRR